MTKWPKSSCSLFFFFFFAV